MGKNKKSKRKRDLPAVEFLANLQETARRAGFNEARVEQLLREKENLIEQIRVLHHDGSTVPDLQAENESLKKEVLQLREEYKQLMAAHELLKKDNQDLRSKNEKDVLRNELLNGKIRAMQELAAKGLIDKKYVVAEPAAAADEAPAPGEKPENVPGENPAEIYESCLAAAAADADPAEDVPDQAALEENPEKAPGEILPITEDPAADQKEEITGKKEKKPEELPALPPGKEPVWDPNLEMYLAENTAWIGKDLWNQKKYKGWFNEEIRQLRAAGKSQQYIADRLRVTQRSVSYRISFYHLDA